MKKILVTLLSLGLLGFLFLVGVNIYVLQHAEAIVSDEQVPTTSVALVFGGGMKENGNMSDMQTDRVKKGIELYHLGKVDKLVMTGDDGQRRFDEVHAMERFAIENQVPDEDVDIDPHGYNTYSSCYRAKHEYGFEEVIAISQQFHLPRIVYFCEHFGIETTGVSADLREYGFFGSLWNMKGREVLARLKGWWQIEVTEPGPIVVGT